MRPDEEQPLPEGDEGLSAGGRGEDDFAGKARKVVRLIAGGFMLVGSLDLFLYWLKCHHDHAPPGIWRCVYLSIPLVIGVAILIKTPALAQYIQDWLEQ
jgi:hypothetical protein